MRLVVAKGAELYLYSFPNHPFNNKRLEPFYDNLPKSIKRVSPSFATEEQLELFHDKNYIEFVKQKSMSGEGYLDYGDTPAFKGCYEAACWSVGTTLNLVERVLRKKFEHGFNPTGGLHHATSSGAAGFCIFNDAAIAIKYLLNKGLKVAYIDTDAHHGDGVFYAFESNPNVIIADIHQDPRTLYPGTGFEHEKGKGIAQGTKLNLPLMPGASDKEFRSAFDKVMEFLSNFSIDFIIWQAGADGMAGDPLTALRYEPVSYSYAAQTLHQFIHTKCEGKLVVLGGGGYNPTSTARAWLEIVKVLATT
ncbi:MAG: acetoin utilization protein AcuC [Candidatus Nanoarchaeia archaeon]